MKVRIVLVQTWHPGNIGAVARAMKTMGLVDLRLVNPVHQPDQQATTMAAGAADVLQQAKQHDSIAEAVSGCTHVLATTARKRSQNFSVLPSSEVFPTLVKEDASDVAILFGRERTGLHNDELQACHHLIYIPTSPAYPSLNLSQAVQVLAYEFFQMAQGDYQPHDEAPTPNHLEASKAPIDACERWLTQVESMLTRHQLVTEKRLSPTLKRFRRLLLRAHPDLYDMEALSGVVSIADKKISSSKS